MVKGFKKTLLASVLTCLCLFGLVKATDKALTVNAGQSGVTVAEVVKFEVPDATNYIFYLSQTDYMTASEWNWETVEGYKWVNELTYEDRQSGNVCNALLDKHLEEYNYGENILINGSPIKNYSHKLYANRYQRVEGFGIELSETVTEITLLKGCQIPTLTYSYFGQGEFSCIEVQEDTVYRFRDGVWVEIVPFEGYETGVEYDASEQFFFKRNPDGNYKGHEEAVNCEFSTILTENGEEEGYSLFSSAETQKGKLLVYDFVNPIDSTKFDLIKIRFRILEARKLISYNSNGITADGLGGKIESFDLPFGWSEITLIAPLYANDEGMVETIVFELADEREEQDAGRWQVAIAWFSLHENDVSDLVYERSLIITEDEEAYDVIFRFNKKGEFLNSELDLSSFLINGVSLEEINAEGSYLTAKWESVSGIYQISIRLSKAYEGNGKIKSFGGDYALNKFTAVKGLVFPNGEELGVTYNYSIYRSFGSLFFENEIIIDKEYGYKLQETKVEKVSVYEDSREENGILLSNLRINLTFNKRLGANAYFYASQSEAWRKQNLPHYGWYNEIMSELFVSAGYKSSLLDSVVINGKTLGEIQGEYAYSVAIFVHCAQTSPFALDLMVDSSSPYYEEIKEKLSTGSGVTVEVLSGLKFVSGVATEKDYKFVLDGGKFVLKEAESEPTVYLDGIKVSDGETVTVDYEVSEGGVWVDGSKNYTVDSSVSGNTVAFTVTVGDKVIKFTVKQELAVSGGQTQQPRASGCTGAVGGVEFGALALVFALFGIGRKKHEK